MIEVKLTFNSVEEAAEALINMSGTTVTETPTSSSTRPPIGDWLSAPEPVEWKMAQIQAYTGNRWDKPEAKPITNTEETQLRAWFVNAKHNSMYADEWAEAAACIDTPGQWVKFKSVDAERAEKFRSGFTTKKNVDKPPGVFGTKLDGREVWVRWFPAPSNIHHTQ